MAAHPRGPGSPKKTLDEHVKEQARFLGQELQPKLDEALAGKRHVFFVDAAHCVFGTFLSKLSHFYLDS